MAEIRVASEKAKFGELFVVRGLCPGLGRMADEPVRAPNNFIRGIANLRAQARPH